jgi:hypothetical protein
VVTLAAHPQRRGNRVYTPMSGWWATRVIEQTQFETPLGVDSPLDVVEWVQLEMDANG